MVAKQKALFTVKFRPCFVCEFFFCYFFPGRAAAFFSSASLPCLHFQHHDRISCWEKGKIFDGVRSFPHFFPIFTKPAATPTYPENFARVVILSGRNFQSVPW